jgi:CO/xanthine dehydrogenase FAD-binding subunit
VLEPTSTDAAAVRTAVADADFEPPSDVHASADYRRHLAAVLAVRAVTQATDNARS